MIELHLHLDGSLRVETALDLAREQKIVLPTEDVGELRNLMEVPEDCKTLHECLKRFDLPIMLIQTESAVERVTFELVEDLHKLGVTYAEIRFAPQFSTAKGLTQDQVVAAAIKGAKRGMEMYPAIRCGLILCCMRGDNIEEKNLETVEVAKKHMGDVVCAIDLAGAESLFPTAMFEPVFEKAKAYGLPVTIHAGEAIGEVPGPESMRKALAYGAKRIGHGVLALEDETLIKELIEKDITLEICVTSNYHTKLVSSLKEHPIKKLFDVGVKVTFNSDNMTVSNTNIHKEIEILKTQLGFTDEEMNIMQNYAREAAFIK
ncbi:MAG: adenosine deaminase [Cellulosilyticum sp.]|nr:adenosine deaminase [Cellulosilyticum sp.]